MCDRAVIEAQRRAVVLQCEAARWQRGMQGRPIKCVAQFGPESPFPDKQEESEWAAGLEEAVHEAYSAPWTNDANFDTPSSDAPDNASMHTFLGARFGFPYASGFMRNLTCRLKGVIDQDVVLSSHGFAATDLLGTWFEAHRHWWYMLNYLQSERGSIEPVYPSREAMLDALFEGIPDSGGAGELEAGLYSKLSNIERDDKI